LVVPVSISSRRAAVLRFAAAFFVAMMDSPVSA
jgi:hypothetical protein